MAELIAKVSGPDVPGRENDPPMFQIKFTEEEFKELLSNPTATINKLGHHVAHLNVSLSSQTWLTNEKKWVESSAVSHTDRARAVYI